MEKINTKYAIKSKYTNIAIFCTSHSSIITLKISWNSIHYRFTFAGLP